MSLEPPTAPRVVKPRKARHSLLPVIAVHAGQILLERSGEVFPATELPTIIVAESSSMIVAEGMGRHILSLSEAFADSDTFQYKLTPIYRDAHPVNGKASRRAVLRDTTASLVGFPKNYHHPIDPVSFIRMGINEIDSSDRPELIKLLEWGKALRNFCLTQALPLKPSAGGLAAQLLRDPRFYPQARRKVPKLINKKGRDKLPGNYYRLLGERNKSHSATYLDMESAHHHIAARVKFPCANHLHAYGHFQTDRPKPWARPGTPRHSRIIGYHGLFHVRLCTPHLPPDTFAPPQMAKQGESDAWIFSNEIPRIEALGGRIGAIYAALVSPDTDEGLSKYAEFAIEQLRENSEQKPWLKPVLHSVYGVLAARPRPMEFGYRIADTENEDVYPMGGKVVPVKVVKTNFDIEASVVNTLHRGMIEAEQRLMSLELAQELHDKGGEIICIYADSLFVKMDKLPLLPRPWAIKNHVTQLQFMSATQFVSPQITRLPGVPRHMRDNFAPAARTRGIDPETSRPVRVDSGTRVFRPEWVIECGSRTKQLPKRKVTNGTRKVHAGDPSGQGP